MFKSKGHPWPVAKTKEQLYRAILFKFSNNVFNPWYLLCGLHKLIATLNKLLLILFLSNCITEERIKDIMFMIDRPGIPEDVLLTDVG